MCIINFFVGAIVWHGSGFYIFFCMGHGAVFNIAVCEIYTSIEDEALENDISTMQQIQAVHCAIKNGRLVYKGGAVRGSVFAANCQFAEF